MREIDFGYLKKKSMVALNVAELLGRDGSRQQRCTEILICSEYNNNKTKKLPPPPPKKTSKSKYCICIFMGLDWMNL